MSIAPVFGWLVTNTQPKEKQCRKGVVGDPPIPKNLWEGHANTQSRRILFYPSFQTHSPRF
jgi:hypothetical protein